MNYLCWLEKQAPKEYGISQLTAEQTVLLVADRPNVSESEQDVLLVKHPRLAQPQPSPLFRASRSMNIEPTAAAGIGKRTATVHGQGLERM
jgi:hypothetical protein